LNAKLPQQRTLFALGDGAACNKHARTEKYKNK